MHELSACSPCFFACKRNKDINRWTISVKFLFNTIVRFNEVKNFPHVHKLGTSRTMLTSSTCTLKEKIDVVHHNDNKQTHKVFYTLNT